ncbi:hypothetical protein VNO78_27226 [Psophocarpus tetragonolobus]|uniref:Uncharacterized protein n=1 Tax=Psophocarpus tetragonolobus TaxID=3891 RepID=A0AAN9XBZ3_PSOTE
MSLQAQPQQPVQVYPTNQPPSSHHSNGSFGAVFIVLAIILVISIAACFLGRLCNKRYNSHSNNHSQRPSKQHRPQILNLHPREHEGDIEFGVDKRMPPPIIRTKGHDLDHGHGHHGHGAGIGPHQLHVNDHMKEFEMRHGHSEELRAHVNDGHGHGHHGHGAGIGLHQPHVNDHMKEIEMRPGHGEEFRVRAGA